MDGRYTILGSIAKGGMATVYLGRVTGSAGFSRLVAIKRLHPELAAEREFVAMLVDEARLASQIRHTNVADTLDLVVADGAFSLVLEYVEGDSLSALLRRVKKSEEKVPLPIAISILYGVLRGLDSAHDARNDDGGPLGIVHRDVSPQNILVGVDGIPRVIDFGVAKAIGRFDSTRPGEIRGKFSYMAPEQMQGRPVTRQVDVYSAGVVLWELLAGAKLFDAEDSRVICAAVLSGVVRPPSSVNPDVPAALDAVVLRATARELGERYLTARELLAEIEKFERASDDEVGAWVRRLCAKRLAERQRMIQGAPPSAEGRPIDELMADLAREGADGTEAATRIVTRPLPAVGTDPESAHLPTAGGGFELGEPRTSTIVPVPRQRNVLVPAFALAGAFVLAGLIVRLRSGESGAASAGPSSTTIAPIFPPPPSSIEMEPVPTAASAPSEDDETRAVLELGATPATSSSSLRAPRKAGSKTKQLPQPPKSKLPDPKSFP
jgi:tRNA A-37 threonylcarbamoyl transferase component Bud32